MHADRGQHRQGSEPGRPAPERHGRALSMRLEDGRQTPSQQRDIEHDECRQDAGIHETTDDPAGSDERMA